MELSGQTVERLSAIRRFLRELDQAGRARVFSHELAACWRASPAQVRRDLMLIGYQGSNAKGYDVPGLRARIDEILRPRGRGGAALVGVGHLGRALLSYFGGRAVGAEVRVAFDADSTLADRVIHGCRVHHIDRLEEVLEAEPVPVGIVAVPGEAAPSVATRLVRAGVGGLVNFAPVELRVPEWVYVQKIDLAVLLEKTAYFAQRPGTRQEAS